MLIFKIHRRDLRDFLKNIFLQIIAIGLFS